LNVHIFVAMTVHPCCSWIQTRYIFVRLGK